VYENIEKRADQNTVHSIGNKENAGPTIILMSLHSNKCIITVVLGNGARVMIIRTMVVH
jgi:hypothetical protein